jgi:hypothetical protein
MASCALALCARRRGRPAGGESAIRLRVSGTGWAAWWQDGGGYWSVVPAGNYPGGTQAEFVITHVSQAK